MINITYYVLRFCIRGISTINISCSGSIINSISSIIVLAVQSWALSVFLNFFNNKNDCLHFLSSYLTGSGIFK